jgi:hypothetical protein
VRRVAAPLQRVAAPLLGAALLLLPEASARAQESRVDSVARACLASDTATRWQEVARAWSERAGRPASNDSLHDVLLELRKRDQALRTVAGLADSMESSAFRSRLLSTDYADATALTRIVDLYGWPTPELVGTDGAEAAWLVVQHNPSLQRPMLAKMLALPPGSVSPSNLALLRDRVLTSEGKPQLYGTQIRLAAQGGASTFYPIADLAHLDERRAEAGLFPFDTYLCLLRGMYEREVVDPRRGRRR